MTGLPTSGSIFHHDSLVRKESLPTAFVAFRSVCRIVNNADRLELYKNRHRTALSMHLSSELTELGSRSAQCSLFDGLFSTL